MHHSFIFSFLKRPKNILEWHSPSAFADIIFIQDIIQSQIHHFNGIMGYSITEQLWQKTDLHNKSDSIALFLRGQLFCKLNNLL
jgi:hypothetical protein